MRARATPALGVLLLALLACGEPTPYVQVRLRWSGSATRDPARLHVEMDSPHDPTTPPKLSPETPTQLRPMVDGFDLDFMTGIGPTRYVYLSAWYDENGNGKKDSGDFAGSLAPAPFAAHDRGLCAGNKNRAPDVTLAPVP